MLKYLGWLMAITALVGAYWVFVQGQKRELALQQQLQTQQQLVAQVSNRLAVVEAQFSQYKLKQEREAREREQREREWRERDAGLRPGAVSERPVAPPRPAAPEAEPLEEEPVREEPPRRNSNPARSIGDGINNLLDRLRGGFGN